MTTEWQKFERRWEDLKALRTPFETFYRDADTYVYARKVSTPIVRGAPYADRSIVDNTGVVANSRLGNMLHGYLFNPFSPFFRAVLRGRDPKPRERDWLDKMSRAMHARLTGSASLFRVAMGEALGSASGYGTAPVWIGRARNGAPVVNALPLWDVWLDENPETQQADTLFRRFRWPAWRAAQKWTGHEKLDETARKTPMAVLTFVQAIEPNMEGVPGAVRARKPFTETIWHIDGAEKLASGGYDSFPAAGMRWARRPGEIYGTSPAMEVMGWIKLLNGIEDDNYAIEEQRANPPMLDYSGGAVDVLDRRPGATIPMDAMMRQRIGGRVMEPLYDPASVAPNYERTADLRRLIDKAFFVDWLAASITPADRETAASVRDRRDLRLRSMASVVSRMEHDFNAMAERMFTVLDQAGLLPPAPESLDGEELAFEFVSPLKLAQQQGDVEKLNALLDFTAKAAALDPVAAKVPVIPELVREGGRALGAPEHLMHAAEDVDSAREAEQEQQGAAQEADMAARAAQILRDGGQGAAALAKAQTPGGGLL